MSQNVQKCQNYGIWWLYLESPREMHSQSTNMPCIGLEICDISRILRNKTTMDVETNGRVVDTLPMQPLLLICTIHTRCATQWRCDHSVKLSQQPYSKKNLELIRDLLYRIYNSSSSKSQSHWCRAYVTWSREMSHMSAMFNFEFSI